MDRPGLEHDLCLVLEFFRGPPDFRSKMGKFLRAKGKTFRKDYQDCRTGALTGGNLDPPLGGGHVVYFLKGNKKFKGKNY